MSASATASLSQDASLRLFCTGLVPSRDDAVAPANDAAADVPVSVSNPVDPFSGVFSSLDWTPGVFVAVADGGGGMTISPFAALFAAFFIGGAKSFVSPGPGLTSLNLVSLMGVEPIGLEVGRFLLAPGIV